MNRRRFLYTSARLTAASLVSAATRLELRGAAKPTLKHADLRITRIAIQQARGRRLTPVAPNAYAPYRGFDVSEPILRVQTAQGLEGIAHNPVKPETVKPLLGMDPFALFDWDGDVILRAAEPHSQLLADLRGADVAILDLLGKALKRPIADLLGKRVRERVPVYDSSLYMEDLLKPSERNGLVYLKGVTPSDPAELVAKKALWVLDRPEGVRMLKIKIGRVKWMGDFKAALKRDIDVFKAVRRAVGKDVILCVDGNDGYKSRPDAAAEFAESVASLGVYWMEEMFPEDKLVETREEKRRLRAAGMATKLADGESLLGGIREEHRKERFAGPDGEEPLFDIDQADMNNNGYLRLRTNADDCARRGMKLAPHNFGSKLGLYAMIHLGLVIPNWEFAESDDTQIPALVGGGFRIRGGIATLAGGSGLGVTLREEALEKPSTVFGV